MFLGGQDAPRRTQGFRPEDAAWHGHAWPEFPSGAEPRALSTSSVGLLSTPHPIPSLGEALGRLLEGETPGPEQTPEGRARMSRTHTAQDRAKILAHENPGSTP